MSDYDDYETSTLGIVTCGPNEALVISGMCQVIFLILFLLSGTWDCLVKSWDVLQGLSFPVPVVSTDLMILCYFCKQRAGQGRLYSVQYRVESSLQ